MRDEAAKLVDQCRGGRTEAFEKLLDEFEKPIFNVVLRMVGNSEDAKDITQVSFLKAFENLSRYKPEFKFFSWVCRIALNEAINHVKSRQRLQPMPENQTSEQGNPEHVLERAELGEKVQELLMQLKPDQRAVIILRHFRDCSYREIGRILELPEATVKSTLFSARKFLRKAFLSSGIRKC